jgi:predicted HTH transcriptional regulator
MGEWHWWFHLINVLIPQEQIRELVARPEGESLEREARLSDEAVAAAIASLANSGGGQLVIGAGDDHTVEGVDVERARALVNHAIGLLEPHPEHSVRQGTLDGRDLLVVDVEPPQQEPIIGPHGAELRDEHGEVPPISARRLVKLAGAVGRAWDASSVVNLGAGARQPH